MNWPFPIPTREKPICLWFCVSFWVCKCLSTILGMALNLGRSPINNINNSCTNLIWSWWRISPTNMALGSLGDMMKNGVHNQSEINKELLPSSSCDSDQQTCETPNKEISTDSTKQRTKLPTNMWNWFPGLGTNMDQLNPLVLCGLLSEHTETAEAAFLANSRGPRPRTEGPGHGKGHLAKGIAAQRVCAMPWSSVTERGMFGTQEFCFQAAGYSWDVSPPLLLTFCWLPLPVVSPYPPRFAFNSWS